MDSAGASRLDFYQGVPLDVPSGRGAHVVSFGLMRPNPALSGRSASLDFVVPRGSQLSAVMLDIMGRRVATPEVFGADDGVGYVRWSGRNLSGRPAAAGVYFLAVRLQAPDGHAETIRRRMVVLR